jgi:hypothetical protein
MSKRSRRMGKSRASKATMKKASVKRGARKVSRKSRRSMRRSSRRRSMRKSMRRKSTRKMSAYQKFVKTHRGAIKAEARKSGRKFLKVAAVMYKASGAKPASKKVSKRRMSKKVSVRKMSAPANMRLNALFARLPSRMAAKKSRRMSKRKASKRKASKRSARRVSRKTARRSSKRRMSKKTAKKVSARKGRKAGGLALFIKQHKAEVMSYAKEHGMLGKPGYVIKAGAAVYKARK